MVVEKCVCIRCCCVFAVGAIVVVVVVAVVVDTIDGIAVGACIRHSHTARFGCNPRSRIRFSISIRIMVSIRVRIKVSKIIKIRIMVRIMVRIKVRIMLRIKVRIMVSISVPRRIASSTHRYGNVVSRLLFVLLLTLPLFFQLRSNLTEGIPTMVLR